MDIKYFMTEKKTYYPYPEVPEVQTRNGYEDSCLEQVTQPCEMGLMAESDSEFTPDKPKMRDTNPKLTLEAVREKALVFEVSELLGQGKYIEAIKVIVRFLEEESIAESLVEILQENRLIMDALELIWNKMPDHIKALEIIAVLKDIRKNEGGNGILMTIVLEILGHYDPELGEKGLNDEVIFMMTSIKRLINILHNNNPESGILGYILEKVEGLVLSEEVRERIRESLNIQKEEI